MRVFTSSLGAYTGEDRLNITRQSGGPPGEPFAPRNDVFRAAVKRKMDLQHRRTRSSSMTHVELVQQQWREYAEAYFAWIEESHRHHPEAWRALLAREEVTLVCYCVVPTRCHRSLLAAHLVGLGAIYEGER